MNDRAEIDRSSAPEGRAGGERSRPSTAHGTTIANRYIVERLLGRGGMASVYLAHDRLVDRPVALKILRRELANSVAMERFTREIGVIARLRHAHIVPLHDSGMYEELPFYVMAYIDGETLQDRMLREGSLPIGDVARLGAQIAEALAYAHREGVLHRDVTPGNILLADANAYVVDFGIARLFHESAEVRTTQSGFILGTPTYMSPEQASGELECDGRSDIYSLGCVLYEVTTGTPPFAGSTPQAVIAGRFGPPPLPVHVLRTDAPSALSDTIARAMQSAPTDRFQTAAEMSASLSVAAPADPWPNRVHPRRVSARRALALAALVGSAVLGAIYLAGARWTPLRAWMNERAIERAIAHVARGDWARADVTLRAILGRDPANAVAHLWVAQTGALAATLAQEPDLRWKAAILLAEDGSATMDSVQRLRLSALRAYADGAHDVARERYRRLVALEPANVATRLALADASLTDILVERDTASASSWRFRGSWEGGVRVLQSALDLQPSSPLMRAAIYDRLKHSLITSSHFRSGRARSGPERAFAGFPALDADTLAYVPYPLAEVASGIAESRNTTLTEAHRRNRERLRRVAADWVADLPNDPAAHRAYAIALAAEGILTAPRAGAPDAVGEIRRARTLARDATARLSSGALEVRLLVRAGRMGEARALADTLIRLAAPQNTEESEILAALSTLRGDARGAVAHLSMSGEVGHVLLTDGRQWTVPATVMVPWKTLEAFAAVGRSPDSILAARDRLDEVIRRDVAPDMVPVVRTSLMIRALTLAAPTLGAEALAGVDPGRNLIAGLIRLALARDTTGLRRGLRTVDDLRRARDAASLSIDGAYLLSWLRLVAADTAGAERQMDTMLEQLGALTNGPPTDLMESALVGRLMRQRASVARRRGQEAVAIRWHAAADTLWQ